MEVNGLAYIAAGAGAHPTVVLFHGFPGIEKNLDLAHAIRRAGWNVVTLNYRGSWGSPGTYSFKGNLEDAREKVRALIAASLREPKRRRASRPTAASRERRLEAKKHRGTTKRLRARPTDL